MAASRAFPARRPRPAEMALAAMVALAAGAAPGRAAGDPALGAYLSSECTACHQTSGRQQGAIPAIVGIPADQFVALMNAYKDRQRENPVMRTIAGRLTAEEVEALAAYYAELKPAP